MGKQVAWKGNGPNLIGSDVENDELHGGKVANHIQGLGGDDNLNGGDGDDTLIGGDGNDTIVGDDGSDILSGGAGADVFALTAIKDSQAEPNPRDGAFEQDTITDFSVADGDKINFSGVSNGAITDFSQISTTVDGDDLLVRADVGGFDYNDVGVRLLGGAGLELTADNFIFAA